MPLFKKKKKLIHPSIEKAHNFTFLISLYKVRLTRYREQKKPDVKLTNPDRD